jgi:hypothetical protein
VTSERKIKANRINAQASTGPRTAQGRARAARNAFRHGLSLPIHSDPALSEEVERLAREIAGPAPNGEVQELANEIAEAVIDLRRVRHARHRLLADALCNPYRDSRANMGQKAKLMCRLLRPNAPEMPELELQKLLTSTTEGPEKFATILLQELKELSALDRYERRALSRRRFAIRVLDEARTRSP